MNITFTRRRPSQGPPVADLLLGSVPAGSILEAAYEEGERHGQDDDAAHHRSQHGHSEAAVLGPGDRCIAKGRSCALPLTRGSRSAQLLYVRKSTDTWG